MRKLLCHLSAAVFALTIAGAPVHAQVADNSGQATFTVLLNGSRIGFQTVTVATTRNGWTISSTGRLDAPIEMVTTKFEVSYGPDWQPLQLAAEGLLGGQPVTLETTFAVTTATNEVTERGRRSSNVRQISPRAVVLPANFFGAYEALAARLASATSGTRIPIYAAPDAELVATVSRVTPRRIATPDGPIEVREFVMTLTTPSGMVPLELWTDARQRLARIVLPGSSLVVVRDDLASVMAREEQARHAGDETAFIPANGFSLAATITKPPTAALRAPAVILVAAPGPEGRDYVSYGVPIFGQIAGALADAGYLVVRYDARGTGQSGGRTENATLAEYAGDAINVVSWLRKRKDVDSDRISVVGYAGGGPVALLAASREDRVKAVALIAAAGRSGLDVISEQQEQMLSRLDIPASEKASRAALQSRVNAATVTGKGWEGVPPNVRRQAETPWFKSWLLFDPAPIIGRLKQPLLIVQGTLDTQNPLQHADRLEQFSRARKNLPASHTRKVLVPNINHLLVPANTGDVDEYPILAVRNVSPDVHTALATWLTEALPGQ